jgi:hypothetical protein
VFDTPSTSAPTTNNGAPSLADTTTSAPAPAPAPAPATAPAPAQDSTQQKPADAPAPAPAAAPAEAPKTEGEEKPDVLTPAMYESLTLPQEVGMGADDIKGMAQVAIANNVKPEAMKAMVEAHAASIKAQQDQWAIASASDPLIGGEKMEQNLAIAVKGLKAYGDPEVNALLKQTPLGTHPAILRLLYRVGQTVQEDRHVNSGGTPAGTRSAAEIMFGGN